MKNAAFAIGGYLIKAGSRKTVELPLPGLYTQTPVSMPVHIVHGRSAGPVVFVCAAVHGDEINGVEIIRRLLNFPQLTHLKGTLVAVSLVNVFGFLNRSRYLPDRRDLNRSFPGTESGSLASRLAYTFLKEIVSKSSLGIDLHTAAIHRDNLPQLRVDLTDQRLLPLARAFGAPVILDAGSPEGSLRNAASKLNIPIMVYEAGEALRFDESCIRIGLAGIINVLRKEGMLSRQTRKNRASVILKSSNWIRADKSGILRALVKLGDVVEKGDTIGYVSEPFGEIEFPVTSEFSGIVIGRTNLPLVYEGEALFHIGRTTKGEQISEQLGVIHEHIENEVPHIMEEPPIV
ncbi:MAG: succinylglutamate desuccinylase/aspartoacylase family protein [Gammaproteobacteria bacterium]